MLAVMMQRWAACHDRRNGVDYALWAWKRPDRRHVVPSSEARSFVGGTLAIWLNGKADAVGCSGAKNSATLPPASRMFSSRPAATPNPSDDREVEKAGGVFVSFDDDLHAAWDRRSLVAHHSGLDPVGPNGAENRRQVTPSDATSAINLVPFGKPGRGPLGQR